MKDRVRATLNNALIWLGRRGTLVLAVSLFVGIAVPPLGVFIKPFVSGIIFLLLFFAILRVDPVALRGYVRRPALVVGAALWTMLALPALLCLVYRLAGIGDWSADMMLALVLQLAAPPIMSSPAIAALLGLDAALVLAAMVACTAIVPLTAPAFMQIFAGDTIALSSIALGFRLSALLGGAGLAAFFARRLAGADRVSTWGARIDGVNVIIMSVFIFALMGDVGARMLSQPALVAGLTLLSFLLTFLLCGLTAIVFAGAGKNRAMALGLLASQRNMGLMLAALGPVLPDMAWLYFAVAQLPIYLLPQIIRLLVTRLNAQAGEHSARA